jgi:hypothetical protein
MVPVQDLGPSHDAGGGEGQAPGPDAPGPADGQTRAPDAQRTSCTDQGITLTASATLTPCQQISVTATASTSYNWVMVGITSAKGDTEWVGGATNVTCNGTCSWTFPKATVPCDPGPYVLSLMRDAQNDDPSLGTIVASCTP